MKLRIVTILLVIIILIMQVPAFAEEELPDPPVSDTYTYWVIVYSSSGSYEGMILYRLREPITVTTDEKDLIFKEGPNYPYGYQRFILEDNEWKYDGGITDPYYFPMRISFDTIHRANHDIAYEDGSGFFFRAELPEPDDDENGFWENLEEFFSWFNPDSWLSDITDRVQESVGVLVEPLEELKEGFNNFVIAMGEIINLLNPWHENFFMRVAFIPSAGYMEDFRTDIKEMFDNKFSFISEIRDFLAFIFSSPIIDNPGPPEFKINLPGGKWGSGSVQIIDFSIFEDYRLFIINFIRVILWIPFLIKLYKKLPSIVY